MPGQGKKYYKIGEVSRITGVEPHVLRYWESEFPQIKPRRVARQRLFRKRDVELIVRIRELLHEEGFTINGAKKQLAREQKGGKAMPVTTPAPGAPSRQSAKSEILSQMRTELAEIEKLLDEF